MQKWFDISNQLSVYDSSAPNEALFYPSLARTSQKTQIGDRRHRYQWQLWGQIGNRIPDFLCRLAAAAAIAREAVWGVVFVEVGVAYQ